jgi:hypothetical protein
MKMDFRRSIFFLVFIYSTHSLFFLPGAKAENGNDALNELNKAIERRDAMVRDAEQKELEKKENEQKALEENERRKEGQRIIARDRNQIKHDEEQRERDTEAMVFLGEALALSASSIAGLAWLHVALRKNERASAAGCDAAFARLAAHRWFRSEPEQRVAMMARDRRGNEIYVTPYKMQSDPVFEIKVKSKDGLIRMRVFERAFPVESFDSRVEIRSKDDTKWYPLPGVSAEKYVAALFLSFEKMGSHLPLGSITSPPNIVRQPKSPKSSESRPDEPSQLEPPRPDLMAPADLPDFSSLMEAIRSSK